MLLPRVISSWRATVFAGLLLAPVNVLVAQARLAEGRMMRASQTGGPVPVAGEWVVLHRVGTDRAAPLDSVRSASDGRFRFRYRLSGDPQALYFISARYQGIAYFSPPLRADTVRGEDADIIVYETTRDTSDLRMQGRHLVVSAPRGNGREVAEVFELENGGSRTIVATDSTAPLWSIALPEDAINPSVAPGDVTAAAVVFRDGRAELYAPISPGVRQLVIMYGLPTGTTSLSVPVERDVTVLEVLLEEPRATVSGAGLREVAPAPIEDREFHRYLAQDVARSSVVRVTLPAPVAQNRSALRLLAFGVAAVMLGALGVWLFRRRRAVAPVAAGAQPSSRTDSERDVERLIAELATLDARFERDASPSPETKAEYERARGELKARIAAALAHQETRA